MRSIDLCTIWNMTSFKDKKLLILAGAGPHIKIVESAKEMGVYTVVTDNLYDSPAKQIADESLLIDIFDTEKLIAYGKENHIDGVIGFCIDPTQRPAQEIAEGIGTPFFGTKEQTFALTDKAAFKKLCKKCGVDTVPEYTIEDIRNHTIIFPVLVKPTDSRGSRGISICNDYEELTCAIQQAREKDSKGECIIEKFMVGHQDLTISYLVKNGEPILVSLGDRYSGKTEDNLSNQLCTTIQPSRYLHMYLKYVDSRVKNMIRLLNIENGPVFMQGFVDGNTVRMYDPGIRFPGNEYERIHAKATNCNLMKSVISYVLGGKIDTYDGKLYGSYNLGGMCAIQYMINVGPGKIAEFNGLEEIASLPFVIDVQQKHFIGDMIYNTGDVKHRAGEISILIEKKPEVMVRAIQDVQRLLSVRDDYGNNMLISPFEAGTILKLYATSEN